MRDDIEFDAEGATLRGWFYRPDEARGEVPCIVMAHGFSAIKEMHLDEYAEVFCDAGLACVVFDNRGLGASDAAPGKRDAPPAASMFRTATAIVARAASAAAGIKARTKTMTCPSIKISRWPVASMPCVPSLPA